VYGPAFIMLQAVGIEEMRLAPAVRCCSMACLSICCCNDLACVCRSSFRKCRAHQYPPSTPCLISIKQCYRVISCMQSFVWTCTHHLHCPRQSGREYLCISAAQACNQQSMHVAALSQMCRQFEAKRLQATPLEAVSATLQQAVVNKVSADTAYLQLLLQGTLRRRCYLSVISFHLLHHSSHLFLAVCSSCITRLALLLILLLNRPLKKLKNIFLLC